MQGTARVNGEAKLKDFSINLQLMHVGATWCNHALPKSRIHSKILQAHGPQKRRAKRNKQEGVKEVRVQRSDGQCLRHQLQVHCCMLHLGVSGKQPVKQWRLEMFALFSLGMTMLKQTWPLIKWQYEANGLLFLSSWYFHLYNFAFGIINESRTDFKGIRIASEHQDKRSNFWFWLGLCANVSLAFIAKLILLAFVTLGINPNKIHQLQIGLTLLCLRLDRDVTCNEAVEVPCSVSVPNTSFNPYPTMLYCNSTKHVYAVWCATSRRAVSFCKQRQRRRPVAMPPKLNMLAINAFVQNRAVVHGLLDSWTQARIWVSCT